MIISQVSYRTNGPLVISFSSGVRVAFLIYLDQSSHGPDAINVFFCAQLG